MTQPRGTIYDARKKKKSGALARIVPLSRQEGMGSVDKGSVWRPDLGSLLCWAAPLPAMKHSRLLSRSRLAAECSGWREQSLRTERLLFLLVITMN